MHKNWSKVRGCLCRFSLHLSPFCQICNVLYIITTTTSPITVFIYIIYQYARTLSAPINKICTIRTCAQLLPDDNTAAIHKVAFTLWHMYGVHVCRTRRTVWRTCSL